MKKIILLIFVLFLSACGNTHISHSKLKTNSISLPPISVSAATGIFVSVSDPHIYSNEGPLAISGSYYFDPRFFYYPVGNLNRFKKSYSN